MGRARRTHAGFRPRPLGFAGTSQHGPLSVPRAGQRGPHAQRLSPLQPRPPPRGPPQAGQHPSSGEPCEDGAIVCAQERFGIWGAGKPAGHPCGAWGSRGMRACGCPLRELGTRGRAACSSPNPPGSAGTQVGGPHLAERDPTSWPHKPWTLPGAAGRPVGRAQPCAVPLAQVPSAGSRRRKEQHYRSVISDIFDGSILSLVQCLTCDRVSALGVQRSAASVEGGGGVLHLLPSAPYLPTGNSAWSGRGELWKVRPRLAFNPTGVHYGGDIPGPVAAHSWQGGPGQAPLGHLPERAGQARRLRGQLRRPGLACLHRGVYPTVCPLPPTADTQHPAPDLQPGQATPDAARDEDRVGKGCTGIS